MHWLRDGGPVFLGILFGIFAGGVVFEVLTRLLLRAGHRDSAKLLEDARREADDVRRQAELDAKEDRLQRRDELDREIEEARKPLREQERRLDRRADQLDEQLESLLFRERELDGKTQDLSARELALADRNRQLDDILARQRETLHRISSLSRDDARALLLTGLQEELGHELGGLILKHDQMLKSTCEQKAREVLATAIQRYAAGHTAETTTSTIDIPSDDMKGRIIGREGRNIRAFEKATGVDLIVDDTPGIVIVSGFDNIRRETAKLALEKLIQDGRIHPTRIEEIVEEAQLEMTAHVRRLGEQAAQEADVPGLHEKLIEYLGSLKFRTSYSQNVLRHSIEVAFLTGLLAEEIGLDGKLGRRCGLLHDIGKAADHEMDGGHPAVGAELARRHGESPEVIHAALGHHDDLRADRPYTILVAAADAVSASRPGARRESLEKYVRRLEELEAIAQGFPGVEQAFAVQAGREVRVIVDSARLTDEAAAKLSRDVAAAISAETTFPGEVKVVVLRETRSVEYAR